MSVTDERFGLGPEPPKPTRISPRELSPWPIQINDAPIRCLKCGEPIVGSGDGTFALLRSCIERHIRICPNRYKRRPVDA